MRNKNIWIGIGLDGSHRPGGCFGHGDGPRASPHPPRTHRAGAGCHHRLAATVEPPPKLPPRRNLPPSLPRRAEPTIEPTATAEPTAEATATTAPASTDEPDAGAEETAPVTVTSPSGTTSTPVPEDSEEPQATFDPSTIKAWLLVTAGSITYQPIPLIEEGEYSVIQEETGAENVIHVTTESVDMKSSTCENQDCVKQGVVSLDNRDSRLLGNMIICLPNQVTLELYTTEELIQMLSGT